MPRPSRQKAKGGTNNETQIKQWPAMCGTSNSSVYRLTGKCAPWPRMRSAPARSVGGRSSGGWSAAGEKANASAFERSPALFNTDRILAAALGAVFGGSTSPEDPRVLHSPLLGESSCASATASDAAACIALALALALAFALGAAGAETAAVMPAAFFASACFNSSALMFSCVAFSFAWRSSCVTAGLPQPSPPAAAASFSVCFRYRFLNFRSRSTHGALIFSSDAMHSSVSFFGIFSFLSILAYNFIMMS
mmetsp:Transcript_6762/g.19228  ORF Transcript_6762/g.19228 Transcript_6762/m.19228 type:complete len:251 (-) Transcript_6762:370-1122(-)